MTDAVERLVPQAIRDLHAYHVPPAGDMVKLDAMENPYPMPDDLRQRWIELLASVNFNRYPDPASHQLKAAIRKVFAVPAESGMVLGNGSDELIQMLAMLVGGEGRTFLSPEPSFSMYRLIAKASGTNYVECRLNTDFSIDAGHMYELVERHQPACIFLAYPNNPTGNSFDPLLIEGVLQRASGLVVVDEAYQSFSGKSMLADLPQYPNMLVMRTLSKSGLAGLRLGMMMGHPDWLEQLEKIRLPYNINVLSQVTALFCLQNYDVFAAQATTIVETRQWLMTQLQQRQLTIYPSDTNFVLIRFATNANDVFQSLKQQGILVKNLHGSDPALENCLRITVGSRPQCEQFLIGLDRALATN